MTKPTPCECLPDSGFECSPCMDRKWDEFVNSYPAPPEPSRYVGGRFGDRCPECGSASLHDPSCQQ